jgi:hypothetical protein
VRLFEVARPENYSVGGFEETIALPAMQALSEGETESDVTLW